MNKQNFNSLFFRGFYQIFYSFTLELNFVVKHLTHRLNYNSPPANNFYSFFRLNFFKQLIKEQLSALKQNVHDEPYETLATNVMVK